MSLSVRYTFKAEGARELGFKKKDIIRIRREVDANWIEGELNDCVGIFPRNYVEILDPGALLNGGNLLLTDHC